MKEPEIPLELSKIAAGIAAKHSADKAEAARKSERFTACQAFLKEADTLLVVKGEERVQRIEEAPRHGIHHVFDEVTLKATPSISVDSDQGPVDVWIQERFGMRLGVTTKLGCAVMAEHSGRQYDWLLVALEGEAYGLDGRPVEDGQLTEAMTLLELMYTQIP